MTMNYPPYTPVEARDRETFLALLAALSYPGRIQTLPITQDSSGPMAQIGMALLDLETRFYTRDALLADTLKRTGATAHDPQTAEYHFYPVMDSAALGDAVQARPGTMLRPDEGATLIIAAAFARGNIFRLRGPGIQDMVEIRLGGIPARFWSKRREAGPYPMGWDVFIVDGDRVIGLPRTTTIEAV
jgi:alpha-D-ribose 1-methylphosphonate 5-triphosphate synthase subunit PhnH